MHLRSLCHLKLNKRYFTFTEILIMEKPKLLIIGLVWPEPTSSAAGTRMLQLINLFLEQGFQVTFAAAAAKSEFSFDLPSIGVSEQEIRLNDSSFDVLVGNLNPAVVMFDRFMTEEQYGWRVQQQCPDAVLVLDTEDLHLLRLARQEAFKKGREFVVGDLFSDQAKREIASILRCDLSLLISETEQQLLIQQFHLHPSLIYYLPFLEEEISEDKISHWRSFDERMDFIFIGNFLHEPNWNAVQVLKTTIWPLLRKALPKANLHIYGAYPSQKVLQLHNPKENFYIRGRAANARETISNYKILLAPLQFGAGVKGKLIDAMQSGTPSMTTTIGAEAISDAKNWNGFIEDDPAAFAEKAAELYQNRELWTNMRRNGIDIINQRYSKKLFGHRFIQQLFHLMNNLAEHRQQNFFGQLLRHHTVQSTKYMSLWIEEKGKRSPTMES